jgi:hypothetical protein
LEQDGPFDGVIGFSQGAAAAAMTASLLEPGRREAFADREKNAGGMAFPSAFARLSHPPLRFMVSYSGFASTFLGYAAFYKPLIATPSLHFLGTLSTLCLKSPGPARFWNLASIEVPGLMKRSLCILVDTLFLWEDGSSLS